MEWNPEQLVALAVAVLTLGGLIHRAAKNIRKAISEHALGEQADSRRAAEVDEFRQRMIDFHEALADLSGKLQAHMSVEDKTSEQIRLLNEELLAELGHLSDRQVQHILSTIKGNAMIEDYPTLIHRVVEGHYELVWANREWTNWTGLTFEQTRAGGDFEVIHPKERPIIEATAVDSGQRQEPVDSHYTMVRPNDDNKVVGKVWAHGYPILGSGDDEWYYVTRIRQADKGATEGMTDF